MVILLTRLYVASENRMEFENIFKEISGIVENSEPGTLLYKMVRSTTDPGEYRSVEFYDSAASKDFHFKNPAAAHLKEKIIKLFDGTPEILEFEELA